MKRRADSRNTFARDVLLWSTALGAFLRQARIEAGYKIREMARASGVSHSEISKIESGSQDCKLDTFVRLCAALGFPPGLMLDVVATTSHVYYLKRVEEDAELKGLLLKLKIPSDRKAHRVSSVLGSLVATAIHILRCSSPVARANLLKYPNDALKSKYLALASRCPSVTPKERLSLISTFKLHPISTLEQWGLLDTSLICDYYHGREKYLWLPLLPSVGGIPMVRN